MANILISEEILENVVGGVTTRSIPTILTTVVITLAGTVVIAGSILYKVGLLAIPGKHKVVETNLETYNPNTHVVMERGRAAALESYYANSPVEIKTRVQQRGGGRITGGTIEGETIYEITRRQNSHLTQPAFITAARALEQLSGGQSSKT
jgi:hypothetical protein